MTEDNVKDSGEPSFTVKSPKPDIFYLQGEDGKPVVRIHHDGEVEVFKPVSEAARQFWETLQFIIRGVGKTHESHSETYPENWKHCLIHLNPETGEMHSDGDHSVREWIEDKLHRLKHYADTSDSTKYVVREGKDPIAPDCTAIEALKVFEPVPLPDWALQAVSSGDISWDEKGTLILRDKEGSKLCERGDFIVRAPLGDLHLCKQDDFERRYTRV